MKLLQAVSAKVIELGDKYREVSLEHNKEIVKITKDSTTSNYIKQIPDWDIEVEHINNRFEIEGEIEAVEVTFEVKRKGKRKYETHKEYYKILNLEE